MNNLLKEGFIKADSTNLPEINPFMVWEFLTTDQRFNAPEIRGEKLALSSRENYGDSAIGYVCLQRINNKCFVEARVTPEHRIRGKYNTTVIINEQNHVIEDVSCSGCAASAGGCKHAIAFLMWLHRRSEDLSPTETECYWKKATLSSVGTTLKYIKISDISKKSTASNINIHNDTNFLKNIMKIAEDKCLDSQISRYHYNIEERETYCLSLHKLIIDFFEENKNTHDSASFLSFIKTKISSKLCLHAETLTRNQSNCLLWYELRFGRITASKFYEAAHCKTENGTLVHQILGISKKYDNLLMKRGRDLEKQVLKVVQKLQNSVVKKCGFIVVEGVPFLGASPDGIIQDCPVEVKCPSSSKTYENYIYKGQLKDKYRAQIMLQMFAMKKKKGLFCIADPEFETNKSVHMIWVDWDDKFFYPLLFSASLFWETCIFKNLLKIANES